MIIDIRLNLPNNPYHLAFSIILTVDFYEKRIDASVRYSNIIRIEELFGRRYKLTEDITKIKEIYDCVPIVSE